MLWVVIINISAILFGSMMRISSGFSFIFVASIISSRVGRSLRIATMSFFGALSSLIII